MTNKSRNIKQEQTQNRIHDFNMKKPKWEKPWAATRKTNPLFEYNK